MVLLSNTYYILGFAVNGINNVNISSYERRYLLSSKQSGFVASFYDIAAGITVSRIHAVTTEYGVLSHNLILSFFQKSELQVECDLCIKLLDE